MVVFWLLKGIYSGFFVEISSRRRVFWLKMVYILAKVVII